MEWVSFGVLTLASVAFSVLFTRMVTDGWVSSVRGVQEFALGASLMASAAALWVSWPVLGEPLIHALAAVVPAPGTNLHGVAVLLIAGLIALAFLFACAAVPVFATMSHEAKKRSRELLPSQCR